MGTPFPGEACKILRRRVSVIAFLDGREQLDHGYPDRPCPPRSLVLFPDELEMPIGGMANMPKSSKASVVVFKSAARAPENTSAIGVKFIYKAVELKFGTHDC